MFFCFQIVIVLNQVEKLRKELRNEQNANELLRIKKAEIEEDCKAKKEKCMDLEALLERAAVVCFDKI